MLTTVWPGLIAALGAVLGVLLTNAFQNRREVRSLERQRELQEAAWIREDRYRHLADKQEIYSNFIAAMNQHQQTLWRLVDDFLEEAKIRDEPAPDSNPLGPGTTADSSPNTGRADWLREWMLTTGNLSKYDASFASMSAAYGRVLIIAPQNVRELAREAAEEFNRISAVFFGYYVTVKLFNRLERVTKILAEPLRSAMRADLDVPDSVM